MVFPSLGCELLFQLSVRSSGKPFIVVLKQAYLSEARAVTGTAQEQAQHLSRRRLEIRTFFDWFRAIQARV
jgi:tricorn protease-like protein